MLVMTVKDKVQNEEKRLIENIEKWRELKKCLTE